MAKTPNTKQKNDIKRPRVNREIQGHYQVRLVYTNADGENEAKVCTMREAIQYAQEENVDLIEINPNANPPVIKAMEFSKYMYEQKKQAKAQKKNKVELKEITLSVSISKHDLEIKAKKAKEFIEKGDKVKVTLTMKKRELLRREENKRALLEFIVMMEDVATPESMPRDEGNRSVVILKRKNNVNN